MKKEDQSWHNTGYPNFSRNMFIKYSNASPNQLYLNMSKLSRISVEHDYEYPSHVGQFFEIIIPYHRPYKCLLNEKKITVLPGQLVIVQPEDIHQDFYLHDCELVFLTFTIDNIYNNSHHYKVFNKQDSMAHRIIDIKVDSTLEKNLALLLEHKKNSDFQIIAVEKLCEVFFWNLIDLLPESYIDHEFLNIIKNKIFVKQIETYLHQHINKKLNVEKLAKDFGMSRRTLENKFSTLFGNSPSNTFINMKINTAVQMLKSGISIQETAEIMGFPDQFYFSTVFKRVAGYSPSKIKQK